MENLVKYKDFDNLRSKCDHFVTVHMFRELSSDIQNLVQKSDFMTQARELEYMKKDIQRFIVKDEVINRITGLNEEVNTKLISRVDMDVFCRNRESVQKQFEELHDLWDMLDKKFQNGQDS